MARVILFLLLLLGPGGAVAQGLEIPHVAYPTLLAAGADESAFTPAGWRLERSASGDLNDDGAADLAFVLRMDDPRNLVAHDLLGIDPLDTNPRILAIALAAPTGGYRLEIQNHTLIPRRDIPAAADPFHPDDTDFRIERGSLRLSLYRFMSAGGWSMGHTAFTFRLEDHALRLIGYDYRNLQRNTGETVDLSINFLTRRARIATGDFDQGGEDVRWIRIAQEPLLTIEEVGDGLAFDPQGLVSELP